MSLLLKIDKPFNLRSTALSHGWINLDPFSWDNQSSTLSRIDTLDELAVHCHIKQRNATQCLIDISSIECLSRNDITSLKNRIIRILGVEKDLTPFEESMRQKGHIGIADSVANGSGYILRSPTFLEDIIKTIFTCNASWKYTVRMSKATCDAYGCQCPCCQNKSFPDYEQMPRSIDIKVGYRKRVIEQIVETYPDMLKLYNRMEFDNLHDLLLNLFGIGPYSAAHVMMLAGDYRFMPVDREMVSYLGVQYSDKVNRLVQERYQKEWGDWAFLAYKTIRMAQGKNWIGD